MPLEVADMRTESGVFVKVEGPVRKGCEHGPVRRKFCEPIYCDLDKILIPLGDCRPESLIEHPVGVRGERESVAGVVIPGDRVLVDVSGLHDRGGFRVEVVSVSRRYPVRAQVK